jgi:hypothetical protein
MPIKLLTAELASERAWQVYCLMNPSAPREFKEYLDSYLSALEFVDTSSLVVDGVKYLKKLEGQTKKSSKIVQRIIC